jgi:hypothetical protein
VERERRRRVAEQRAGRLPGSSTSTRATRRTGGNETASINEQLQVSGPTTIRLQARHINALGAASISQIYSDSSGFTSLRYDRVDNPDQNQQ